MPVPRDARSAFYAWARLGVSACVRADAALGARIAAAQARSRLTCGVPPIHATLRAGCLANYYRRRRTRTAVADPTHANVRNLEEPNFTAPVLGRL